MKRSFVVTIEFADHPAASTEMIAEYISTAVASWHGGSDPGSALAVTMQGSTVRVRYKEGATLGRQRIINSPPTRA